MTFGKFFRYASKWLLAASLLSSGVAMAQPEPTMAEVYTTAQAGNLDKAQVMIQQVLISHPKSAKAHFVQSELYARQGNAARAREALARAEELAPGLPFAKAESVQALRAQLAARSKPAVARNAAPTSYASPEAPPSSSSWVLPLLLAGGVIVAGYFIFRRKAQQPIAQQPAFADQGGLSGPQNFGLSGAGAAGMAQPGFGQPGYGQPAGSGLGGRIMGGVATGLAVGAGVMAAEAIGRNLMGNHNEPTRAADSPGSKDYQAVDSNVDMGGQNFGVNDAGSWDDGGSIDAGGGGGDWDN